MSPSCTVNPWTTLVRGASPRSQKSTCSLCLPTRLATNSLLLTGSFANNKQWINTYFVCYIHYILYSHNKVSCRKENDERKYILQYLLKTACMDVDQCSSNPCCSQVSCTWYLPGKWGSVGVQCVSQPLELPLTLPFERFYLFCGPPWPHRRGAWGRLVLLEAAWLDQPSSYWWRFGVLGIALV